MPLWGPPSPQPPCAPLVPVSLAGAVGVTIVTIWTAQLPWEQLVGFSTHTAKGSKNILQGFHLFCMECRVFSSVCEFKKTDLNKADRGEARSWDQCNQGKLATRTCGPGFISLFSPFQHSASRPQPNFHSATTPHIGSSASNVFVTHFCSVGRPCFREFAQSTFSPSLHEARRPTVSTPPPVSIWMLCPSPVALRTALDLRCVRSIK